MGPLLRASMYGALFIALLSLGSGQLLAGLGVTRPSSIGIVQMAGVIVTLTGLIIALLASHTRPTQAKGPGS